MSETVRPFYNPLLTYETNYQYGPFGYFLDAVDVELPKRPTSFLGFSVDIPFGIASGPLLNSKFIQAAWKHGYSIATYKTVRTEPIEAHPYPNIVRIDATEDHNIEPNELVYGSLDLSTFNVKRDGITNSFGVPSKVVNEWQADVNNCSKTMMKGNILIVSFMGTQQKRMNRDELIDDYANACDLTAQTDAPILEVNTSCPNVGKAGMICHDVSTLRGLLEAIHPFKKNKPLLVKLGYYSLDQQEKLEEVLTSVHRYAQGVVAINTIQARVVDYDGKQQLPGNTARIVSGVCGAPIRWAGLEMAERIVAYKMKKGWNDFVVVGVGGVVSPEDYFAYMKLDVDAVQSATGAMWNPKLAIEIREQMTA